MQIFLNQANKHLQNTAIIDQTGSYTYADLLAASQKMATILLNGKTDLQEARIAFLCPSGFDYVLVQWAIWQAGGIAVPLCVVHPTAEMDYVLKDSDVNILVVHPSFETKVTGLTATKNIRQISSLAYQSTHTLTSLLHILPSRRAMILYTSGTTGKPKGVVSTHANIESQTRCLIDAWQWTANDHILHILPLHHTHGIINKLCCAMWAGATCNFLPKFDATKVWHCFEYQPINLFMAVPTIYHRLISHWEQADAAQQKSWSEACKKMRLMVSGSAALPVSTLEKWQQISGHILLERYGMTEIGMALSNSYTQKRIPGHVGKPLPNVQTRIVDEEGNPVAPGTQGQLQIKGPNVFLAYWNKPEATTQAFQDGWFCTGDIVLEKSGIFKIVGRNSVDIIKSGGYKISALEIEEVLRTHPSISECAVVGISDVEWGERVAAAVVLHESHSIANINTNLKSWCKDKLAPYKIPSIWQTVPSLPRNVLGKVTKRVLQEQISTDRLTI